MTTTECKTFWGSHGCSLPKGHDPEEAHPIHSCAYPIYNENGVDRIEVCCLAQYVDEENANVRYMEPEDEWHSYGLPLFRNDNERIR